MSVFIFIAENTKEILAERERERILDKHKMPASGDSTNTAQFGDWKYFYRDFPYTFCLRVQSVTAACMTFSHIYLAHKKAKAPLANVKLQRGCLNSLHLSQICKQQAILGDLLASPSARRSNAIPRFRPFNMKDSLGPQSWESTQW